MRTIARVFDTKTGDWCQNLHSEAEIAAMREHLATNDEPERFAIVRTATRDEHTRVQFPAGIVAGQGM